MRIYKGSVYPITVAYAPCYCDDPQEVENLVLNFYTTDSGTSIEFSGSAITISGLVATVVFQPAQLDALDDGVLRFASNFDYSGSPVSWSCATDKYLKTPPAYTPIQIVTESEVQEIVDETISASTAITEVIRETVSEVMGENYYTSAQTDEKIQEAVSGIDLSNYYTSGQTEERIDDAFSERKYVLNLMTQEERVALHRELSQYSSLSGFTPENYNFYQYVEGNSDNGGGFIPMRLSAIHADMNAFYFEGIRNGYTARNFKELSARLKEDGDYTSWESYTGVYTLDGQKGALTTKTINGESIIGNGNIAISTGVTSGEVENMITSALTDYSTSADTASAISTATQNMVTSTYVNNIWVGTTAQYNAIVTKDPNTLYFINDN